ncbi:MAG: hypothetical protein V1826_01615 [bacterium]
MEDNNQDDQPIGGQQPNSGQTPPIQPVQPTPQSAQPVTPPTPILPSQAQQPTQSTGAAATRDKTTEMEDKVFAALSYISILFVVPLVLKHDDQYIQFHAKQGLVLFGAEVVVWFLLFLLESFVVALAPLSGLRLIAWVGALAWILFVALSVLGVYYAWTGKKWKIFLLHRIAEKLKL